MNNNTDMTAKKEMAQESITSDILAFRGIRGTYNIKDKKQQKPTPNVVYTIAQGTPFLTKGRTRAV